MCIPVSVNIQHILHNGSFSFLFIIGSWHGLGGGGGGGGEEEARAHRATGSLWTGAQRWLSYNYIYACTGTNMCSYCTDQTPFFYTSELAAAADKL